MAENKADARVIIFKAGEGNPLVANAALIEDDFSKWYGVVEGEALIKPPYDPRRMEELVERNNTLAPCIDAMCTNIDGTGYEIERRDGGKMEDADFAKVKPATDFFSECCPMMSFQTLRRKTRREIESTGQGFMEIIRDVAGRIVFAGPIESKMMRMGRLGEPVVVDTTMWREGREITFKRTVRPRRYAQKVGEKLIWFKEYGAEQDLHKYDGRWFDKNSLPADQRATEVLYFGVNPDVGSPYHVPRWISQIPSVLGSRNAEEHNLSFFDAGGVPPHMVIVSGGQLAEKTVDAIQKAMNQHSAHARVQVIEAFSTSGDLERGGGVQVKVERFGTESSDDPMFENYDHKCEENVRKAFRLPPILIGKSEDYNFASAHASYLVAEAQVFKPERDEFDEVINSTLMPELLDTRDYVYRSKPISIVDAATQLEVITGATATGIIDPDHVVTLMGEIGGMEFQVLDEAGRAKVLEEKITLASAGKPVVAPGQKPGGVAPPAQPAVQKADTPPEGMSHLIGCMLNVAAAQERFSRGA